MTYPRDQSYWTKSHAWHLAMWSQILYTFHYNVLQKEKKKPSESTFNCFSYNKLMNIMPNYYVEDMLRVKFPPWLITDAIEPG